MDDTTVVLAVTACFSSLVSLSSGNTSFNVRSTEVMARESGDELNASPGK